MNILEKTLNRIFPPLQPIQAGIYRQEGRLKEAGLDRLHLRVEPDQNGLLIVNGSVVIHLNRSAVEYALCLVQGKNRAETIKIVKDRYRIPGNQAAADYDRLLDEIHLLLEQEDLSPVEFLDFDRAAPASGAISAPYRLDCALTYRQPDGSEALYAPVDRSLRELTGAEWKVMLNKAWAAGIPHVVFTGGEPTMHPDLPELVQHVADTGMVCGLISNGVRLADKDYLHSLLNAGLDHLMLILQPSDTISWKVLGDVLAEDISVTVHLTMQANSASHADFLIPRLSEMGVKQISLSQAHHDFAPILEDFRRKVAEEHLHLVWDLPVPYSALNPVAQEMEGTREAGPDSLAFMYIEPDGDVLAAQGYEKVYGNLLAGDWDAIWKAAKG